MRLGDEGVSRGITKERAADHEGAVGDVGVLRQNHEYHSAVTTVDKYMGPQFAQCNCVAALRGAEADGADLGAVGAPHRRGAQHF